MQQPHSDMEEVMSSVRPEYLSKEPARVPSKRCPAAETTYNLHEGDTRIEAVVLHLRVVVFDCPVHDTKLLSASGANRRPLGCPFVNAHETEHMFLHERKQKVESERG